ncbi:MAG: lipoyl synthase [Prevotella sp.]
MEKDKKQFLFKHTFQGLGSLEAKVVLDNNTIADVEFGGDCNLLVQPEPLLARLRGVEFNRESVERALLTVNPAAYISGLSRERLLRLLFGRKPHQKKPDWLKIDLSSTKTSASTSGIIHGAGLHTICQSGLCPNLAECWRNGTATLMIGGDICTRKCRFCNTLSGRPKPLDADEPRRIAQAVKDMGLRYAVITSVDRDDLADYGANHWRRTIEELRKMNPQTVIEALIPDFQGRMELLDIVLQAKPDVVAHNMETVRRLTPSVRSVAQYDRSLSVLRHIAEKGFRCKTGFMVGLGETHEEVRELMADIRTTGCTMLTIGQYLQPTAHHLDVAEYVTPQQFAVYRQQAFDLGFTHVESGPLVRSSYHAERMASRQG